ncbi:hypothetical protein FI667_g11689, partial [Globisporangium splendens]
MARFLAAPRPQPPPPWPIFDRAALRHEALQRQHVAAARVPSVRTHDDSVLRGHPVSRRDPNARPCGRLGPQHLDADPRLLRLLPACCWDLLPLAGVRASSVLGYAQDRVDRARHWLRQLCRIDAHRRVLGLPRSVPLDREHAVVSAFFGSAVMCAIGRQNLRENATLKSQLERYLRTMNFESNLVLIYPVYSAIFTSLTGLGQFSMVFVLPVIKWILKTLFKKIVADLEDPIPVVTITIDLFNALYQSKCMQSAGSIWTTIGIISTDAIQNAHSLRRLFQYMREIEALTNVEIGSRGIVAPLGASRAIVQQHLLSDADQARRTRRKSALGATEVAAKFHQQTLAAVLEPHPGSMARGASVQRSRPVDVSHYSSN